MLAKKKKKKKREKGKGNIVSLMLAIHTSRVFSVRVKRRRRRPYSHGHHSIRRCVPRHIFVFMFCLSCMFSQKTIALCRCGQVAPVRQCSKRCEKPVAGACSCERGTGQWQRVGLVIERSRVWGSAGTGEFSSPRSFFLCWLLFQYPFHV